MKLRKWTKLKIKTHNDENQDPKKHLTGCRKVPNQQKCHEGEDILNINTKRSMSVSSFNTPVPENDSKSTVDFINLNKTKSSQGSSRLQKTCDFGSHTVQTDILSSIKPKKSRNGRPEIDPSFTDCEIEELMKGMESRTSKNINTKTLLLKCKKKSATEELKALKKEYHNCLLQCESVAEDNQQLARQLEAAHQEILSLKTAKRVSIGDESTHSEVNNLQREEIKQAKEYIQELENVVEKSKNNIIFLKDLVLTKDEKNKKLQKEIVFYKELSETHIAESSRLAKEIIGIRSKYNKILNKNSQMQNHKNYQMARTQSLLSLSRKQDSLVHGNDNKEVTNIRQTKPRMMINLGGSKENQCMSQVSILENNPSSLNEYRYLTKYTSGKTKVGHVKKNSILGENITFNGQND
ncbi:unnamed protein product [Moneuplotes crassus]|uniref:Uncharacterized protein n=1 Tax=Euplotes crassus TaxID=5936 RepID=A0AAD1XAV0_EUPCR|nr:unnamed protein product [Moneuplotes crassus]